jgi:hypothetical protein
MEGTATMEATSHSVTLRRLAAALVAAAALAAAAPALAHQASMTWSFVEISRDHRQVSYRLLVSPPDLAEALGLPAETAVSEERLRRPDSVVLLRQYILSRIHMTGDGIPCPIEPLGVDVTEQDGRFVELTWRMDCPDPIRRFVIDYRLFFDLDELHTASVRVVAPAGTATALLRHGEARFVWELDRPPPSGLWGFFREGIDHILFGIDHIFFLLALLLVVAIRRDPAGGWRLRGIGEGLRYTAIIVTAFTVAHSITLVSAALGWISLSSRFVESMIALSIVYVAVENVLRPDPGRRYLVTFAFGLMHGLGFASMLRVILPPADVVAPLLVFNVGVEVGQLLVVAVALPLLHLAARAAGPERYRARLLPVASGLLAAAGCAWLVHRLFFF